LQLAIVEETEIKNLSLATPGFYFTVIIKHYTNVQGKGKAVPLQALTGPEGSKRLRLPDFKPIGT
jgi:hypothetical protein